MAQYSFDNYTVSGDVAVIAICLVIVILLTTSYVSRTRSFFIYIKIIVSLVLAAVINILYHNLLANYSPSLKNLVYVLRISYHALLYDVFFLFTLYTTEVSGMDLDGRVQLYDQRNPGRGS